MIGLAIGRSDSRMGEASNQSEGSLVFGARREFEFVAEICPWTMPMHGFDCISSCCLYFKCNFIKHRVLCQLYPSALRWRVRRPAHRNPDASRRGVSIAVARPWPARGRTVGWTPPPCLHDRILRSAHHGAQEL